LLVFLFYTIYAQAPKAETMNDLLQASLPENKYDISEVMSIVVVTAEGRFTVPFPCDDVPMIVSDIAQAVAAHTVKGHDTDIDTYVILAKIEIWCVTSFFLFFFFYCT
jgi:hypothetical protein